MTTSYDISQLHILILNTGYAKQNADWNWKNVHSPFARIYDVIEGEVTKKAPKNNCSSELLI